MDPEPVLAPSRSSTWPSPSAVCGLCAACPSSCTPGRSTPNAPVLRSSTKNPHSFPTCRWPEHLRRTSPPHPYVDHRPDRLPGDRGLRPSPCGHGRDRGQCSLAGRDGTLVRESVGKTRRGDGLAHGDLPPGLTAGLRKDRCCPATLRHGAQGCDHEVGTRLLRCRRARPPDVGNGESRPL